MTKTYYKEIVNGKIEGINTTHPHFSQKKKQVFIDKFLVDTGLENNEITYYKKCDGLISIKIGKRNIWFYIEHTDGGGTNNNESKTPRIKVNIPFSQKIFQEWVLNEIIMIVNIYVPLIKTNNELSLDNDNAWYLFILPNEIFNAEPYRNIISNKLNKTYLKISPSSRWVFLKDLEKNNLDKTHMYNKKENVIIIPKNNIKNFLISEIEKNIDKWKIEKLLIKFENDENKIRKDTYKFTARREFKEKLIESMQPPRCQNIHHDITNKTVLRGSHILGVAKIMENKELNRKDKIDKISDINNGFMLCANCDALFDKVKFTIINQGMLIIKNDIEEIEQILNCKNGERIITPENFKLKNKYLELHNLEFFEKN